MTLQKKLDRETILQIRKYLRVFPFVGLSICLLLAAVGASAQNTLSVTAPSGFALSPRLTDSQDFEGQNPPKERPNRRLHERGNENNRNEDEYARQGRQEPRMKAIPYT